MSSAVLVLNGAVGYHIRLPMHQQARNLTVILCSFIPHAATANAMNGYPEYNAAKPAGAVNEEKPMETGVAEPQEVSYSTRKEPLGQATIDDYIQRNKHKVSLPMSSINNVTLKGLK